MSLFFSAARCLRSNSNTESQREAGKDERESERERERAVYEREKVRARLQSENQSVHLSVQIFHTDALWSGWFSQIRVGSAPRLPRRSSEREVSTAVSVYVRGYVCVCVCVPSANEGVCLCGKEAKGTT